MATIPQALPRSTRSVQPAQKPKVTLSSVRTNGSNLPNVYGFYATEGFGKTSIGAMTPSPIFLQSRGENGLDTLIQSGQLPPTPSFPECQSWEDVFACIDALLEEQHGYRTLVIDTVNGCERLCHEFVCKRDFGNDWGERGWSHYSKGPEVAIADWLMFIQKLDKLRVLKRMSIFMLMHSKVKTFNNPNGSNYDRYQPDMNDKTYSVTHKWLDAVLFGNFEVAVDIKRGSVKGKATSQVRVMYAQPQPAFLAKNRLGLPAEIDMGDSPNEAWLNFAQALKEGRARKLLQAAEPQPEPESEPYADTEQENS
jgi:hypothetical protein